ncbi:MAG: hypothetical protein AABX66_01915 [Nanoarchaeota archaeon]
MNKSGLFFFIAIFGFLFLISIVSAYDCIDTDNGLNSLVQGTVTFNSQDKYKDVCASGGEISRVNNVEASRGDILEFSCYSESGSELCGSGACLFSILKCPSGQICNNGKCVIEQDNPFYLPVGVQCEDSDSGLNYTVKGLVKSRVEDGSVNRAEDYCVTDKELREWYCDQDKKQLSVIQCDSICSNGRCVDNDKNINEKADYNKYCNNESCYISQNDFGDIKYIDNKKLNNGCLATKNCEDCDIRAGKYVYNALQVQSFVELNTSLNFLNLDILLRNRYSEEPKFNDNSYLVDINNTLFIYWISDKKIVHLEIPKRLTDKDDEDVGDMLREYQIIHPSDIQKNLNLFDKVVFWFKNLFTHDEYPICDKTPNICEDGTLVNSCNIDTNLFCNPNGTLTNNCPCGECNFFNEGLCNVTTKKCEIPLSSCPPYEVACSTEQLYTPCNGKYSHPTTLKLKGDFRIGIIYLSQFTGEQIPYEYIDFLNGHTNATEYDLISKWHKEYHLPGNVSTYSIVSINSWIKEEAKYYLNNFNYVNFEFIPSNNVLNVDPSNYGNESAIISTVEKEAKSLSDLDMILVVSFSLQGADTIIGNLNSHAGIGLNISGKTIPMALINTRFRPYFCNETYVPYSEDCKFKQSNQSCIILTCDRSTCSASGSYCPVSGIWDISKISAHEILHNFGAGDHGLRGFELPPSNCNLTLDESFLPRNSIEGCDSTACAVSYVNTQAPLACVHLCEKEAREIGWRDTDGNNKIEIED